MLKKNRGKLLSISLLLTAIYFISVKKPKMTALRQNKFLAEYLDISTIFKKHVTSVQPIHVVTIMTSLGDTKTFPLQFKSILYHRSSPLVLHLFLNSDLQQRVMETLLSTWPADQVYYEIYRFDEKVNRVTLSVLLDAFRRLPDFTKKAVYMSAKVFFTSDVKEWMPKCDDVDDCASVSFDNFDCSNFDQDNCEEMPQLAFLNLEDNEEFLLQNITEEQIGLLPCHLRALSLQTLTNTSDACYDYASKVKSSSVYVVRDDLLTGEFPDSELSTDLRDAIRTIEASEPRNRLYMSSLLSFEINLSNENASFRALNPEHKESERNSNWKQSETNSTQPPPTSKAADATIASFCEKFLEVAHLNRLTHIFYHYGDEIKKMDAENGDVIEVTLLTALTLDRMGSLETMLTHWTGPAAVLFYVSDSEVSYQLPKLLSSSSVFRSKTVMDRIAIHLVYKTLTFNPINYLRNVLLNNSLTSHNVFIDVDLVPNPGAYESIKKILRNYKDPQFSDKLFMIPAFQAFSSLQNNFPKNKKELLKLIENKSVSGYQTSKKSPGHHSTNYEKWVKANSSYEAVYVRYFEPYLIVAKSLPVRFNEDLVERMQDKIAYVRTFKAMGFKFHVLPEDFIVHLPHAPSHGKKIFQAEPKFTQCDIMMNKRHENYLRRIYPKAKI